MDVGRIEVGRKSNKHQTKVARQQRNQRCYKRYGTPMSSVVMADMTQRPRRCEVCVSFTAMANDNAMNATLQHATL